MKEFFNRIPGQFLGSAHLMLKFAFRRLGFRWELRRRGELKLGLWRRRWGEKVIHPKRLVLIPGFGDTPLSWLSVLTLLFPVIKKRFDEIVIFDFPGFSGFLHESPAIDSMDQLLEMTGDALDTFRPHTLFGHSLGAWVSAHYAASCGKGTRPAGNIRRYSGPKQIILASPSGVFGDKEMIMEWKKSFDLAREKGFDEFRKVMFYKEPIWFRLILPSVKEFFYRDDIQGFMQSIGMRHMLTPLLPKIQANVHFIWGEKDQIVPPDVWFPVWKKGLLKAQPAQDISAVFLNEVGHSLQLENPILTSWVLSRFLRQKSLEGEGKLKKFPKMSWRVVN